MALTAEPTARPTTPKAALTVLSSPSTETSRSSGATGGGIVGGCAFLDANDDGVRHPGLAIEPAAADVNVRLFSCGDDASVPSRLLVADCTDGRGFYSFRNLFSGSYRVMVQPPLGYRPSLKWIGSDGNGEAEADSAMNPISWLTRRTMTSWWTSRMTTSRPMRRTTTTR